MKNISDYIGEIQKTYQTENAREHAYRPALQNLLDSIKFDPDIRVLNDPKRSEHGAPDFVILKRELPIGYVETKDIGIDLNKAETSEQLARYYGYSNLILTDYLEFRFFKNGEKCETISIGEIEDNKIVIKEDKLEALERALKDFITLRPENIKSGLQLAKIMGGKARRIRDNVRRFLEIESESNQELDRIYNIIKKLLIHDLSKEKFSDMYAQTLVYGLFIARYYDESEDTFTRQEARDLVPDSNPFLKNFFEHIAGANFDKRLAYIVNELCEIFSHSDVKALMQQYTKQLAMFDDGKELPDPVIHFYEDFLKEYDSKQRLELGVFYTPLPVVRFIVRSIDEILKKDFELEKGLADSSKIERPIIVQGQKSKEKMHRVQVLDPAAGTGTFLNEVINQIHKSFEGQEGRWKSYVNDDLLPRIYGFELMIASYTIAHLKLGLTLRNMGYTDFSRRLGVYLTNSLEDTFDIQEDLFSIGLANSIAEEAKSANKIKDDRPIMVVLGNPPYSGESQNPSYKGNDIYKLEPGTTQKLQERNPKWLNDDYVKFIRLAESFIERNKDGIIGMITAHGYLDNPTFRGMRWHLANTFDKIYIIDLHGNANKKEVRPDGGKDENVFDIKTGVSIILGVKKGTRKKLADVFVKDIYGLRKDKYVELNNSSVDSVKWRKIEPNAPNYYFVEMHGANKKEYDNGFSIKEVFKKYSPGIVTSRDLFIIDQSKETLERRIQDFLHSDDPESLKNKYNLKEKSTWKIRNLINKPYNRDSIIQLTYRPFDNRWIYYENEFIERSRKNIMQQFTKGNNIGLIVPRQCVNDWRYAFISDRIIEFNLTGQAARFGSGSIFPLYIYSENGEKYSNLSQEIVKIFKNVISDLTDENIFDYIYAVLFSPSYRKKYKDFLKIDFPRIPYPKNAEQFKKLATKGKELRGLHLMESPLLNKLTTTYPIDGTDKVEKVVYSTGSIYINSNQYFGKVSEIAWNFWIGGYQPAQKWLKDRIGRTLSSEDIEHYQKIIIALTETDRIMKEIDALMPEPIKSER